jgi:hypothetical protein
MGQIDAAEIDKRFDHQAPGAKKTPIHVEVRAAYKELAGELAESLPESREKSLAITALEESGFWAQAAIARNIEEEVT